MRKIIFLSALLLSLRAFGQPKEMPDDVNSWISAELAKARQKSNIKNYNSASFFKTDSARIVGYLEGYDVNEKFSTGMVYAKNELSDEDFPTVVAIRNDGRFEVTIPLNYPKIMWMDIKDKFLNFYIEPGQTLALIVNWNEFKKVEYGDNDNRLINYLGPAAQINKQFFDLKPTKYKYENFEEDVVRYTPQQFKQEAISKYKGNIKSLNDQFNLNNTASQVQNLALLTAKLQFVNYLYDYIGQRDYEKKSRKDSALLVEMPVDFYDFINDIDLNDKTLLVTDPFGTFVNRFEFSKAFLSTWNLEGAGDTPQQRLKDAANKKDSIVFDFYKMKQNLIYDISKLRRLPFTLKYPSEDVKADVASYTSVLKNNLKEPYLRQHADKVFNAIKAKQTGQFTKLPTDKAGDIFRKIIANHKGKVLFVDFWATTCGPCVAGIKNMADTRKKHKDNPDFDFIFVTSEDESPIKSYKKFVEEQQLQHSYFLNIDDYRYLRQLFRFNGIPRYAVISADGRIIEDDFQMHNFNTELGEIIPKYKVVR